MRLVSVNTFNLYGDAAQEDRFQRVEAMIRTIDADIVAVQEVIAKPPAPPDELAKRALAERNVQRLADAVDLRCEVDGRVVCALGGGSHHTAILWRDGLEAVGGKVGRFERGLAGMWHSMVTAVFDLGGPRLRVGSVQLSPFDQQWAWSDAAQVMRAMNSDDVPGIVGGDFNGIGADLDYDPDPYVGVSWHPDHAYQLDELGHLDRRVAQRLEGPGRMRDCARTTRAAWAPTTGRHPADQHPPRRIDRWYATYHVPEVALVGFSVTDAETVGRCTDHDPIVVEVDESALQPGGMHG